MTSYINQTIARHQVAELISQAEARRVRRQFRQARRQALGFAGQAVEAAPSAGAGSARIRWGHRFGIAAAR